MTTNIPDNAHNSDISIIEYDVPEFITEIGNCAFFKCINLESVILNKNLTKLGNN